MPAKKIVKEKKPRGKGKAKVAYFSHEHLDVLKRAEATAKSQKCSFADLVIKGLEKVC